MWQLLLQTSTLSTSGNAAVHLTGVERPALLTVKWQREVAKTVDLVTTSYYFYP